MEERKTMRYPREVVVMSDQPYPFPNTASMAIVIIIPETSRSIVISYRCLVFSILDNLKRS